MEYSMCELKLGIDEGAKSRTSQQLIREHVCKTLIRNMFIPKHYMNTKIWLLITKIYRNIFCQDAFI